MKTTKLVCMLVLLLSMQRIVTENLVQQQAEFLFVNYTTISVLVNYYFIVITGKIFTQMHLSLLFTKYLMWCSYAGTGDQRKCRWGFRAFISTAVTLSFSKQHPFSRVVLLVSMVVSMSLRHDNIRECSSCITVTFQNFV